MISVKEVSSKKDLKNFIDLPWKLYKNDPNWVAPLKMAVKDLLDPKHPFYTTSKVKHFLASKEGKIVGRISAIVNEAYNNFHQNKAGFFGFFESINDQDVADALLEKASKFLKEYGRTTMSGPFNLSTNYECGMLIKGFDDPPQIMMTYNPEFYTKLIENAGLSKEMDLNAYKIDPDFQMPEKILRVVERVEKRSKVTFRPVDKKNWMRDVSLMFDIYNDAWETNWGFVPMSKEEFFHTASDMKMVVNPKLASFVEVGGEAAGFIVNLPDYNQVFKKIPSGKLFPFGFLKLLRPKKYITRSRVLTMGLKQKYRKLGLEALLYYRSQQAAVKEGIPEIEMSWVLEDNINMNKPLLLMGGELYKQYRIYQKELS